MFARPSHKQGVSCRQISPKISSALRSSVSLSRFRFTIPFSLFRVCPCLLGWFEWGRYRPPTGRYGLACGQYHPLMVTWSPSGLKCYHPSGSGSIVRIVAGAVASDRYRLHYRPLLAQTVGSCVAHFDWFLLSG
jgi:hypothetical protein